MILNRNWRLSMRYFKCNSRMLFGTELAHHKICSMRPLTNSLCSRTSPSVLETVKMKKKKRRKMKQTKSKMKNKTLRKKERTQRLLKSQAMLI